MKLTFADILTLIFITLKLTHVIDWSWFLILLPSIIMYTFVTASVILAISFPEYFKLTRNNTK